MKKDKIILILIVLTALNSPVYAESLFRAGVSQDSFPIVPRSLFSSVKAKGIGDLVTVVINEALTSADDLTLEVNKTSTTTDNYRNLWNSILPGKPVSSNLNKFGGTLTSSNSASTARKRTLTDTLTAQVVQVLPNGNLVIQGKKTAINAGEKVDLLLSGVVDPRLLSTSGSINSTQVANLQLSVNGKGTISRSDSEGTINKIIRYLF